VESEQALERLRSARVGRLSTVSPEGRPHVVPFVFALVRDAGSTRVYWAVDDKPKRSTLIQRLRNLEANPAAELVVDGYDEDWDRLWWVRARGSGRLVLDRSERAIALAALRAKYPRYRDLPDDASVVAIDVDRVSGWTAS
jgi:PPOX class probable F420-dependent enzyme